MIKIILYLTFTLLLISSHNNLHSNTLPIHQQFKFKHITIDNGLSDNHINSMCQDADGYIWIATRYGLNKFNGLTVKNYFFSPTDTNSLPANVVLSVFCDSNGKLWVGTINGICYYDEKSDGFNKEIANRFPKAATSINDIVEDKSKNIWFATNSGLIKYLPKTDKITVYSQLNLAIPSNNIYKIDLDGTNKLWISCYQKGVSLIDFEAKKIRNFQHAKEDNKSLSENWVERIYKDKSGDVWIGTSNEGVNKYNPIDSTFTRYLISDENSYSNRVRSIFEDHNNNLYLGTRAGIFIYNQELNSFSPFASTSNEFSRLSANSVCSKFRDATNGLWIGTIYGGVNYSNLEENPFISYTAREDNDYYLNNTTVFGMDEDAEGNVYIGTENGVNILDQKKSKFTYLVNDPTDKNTLSYNDVKSIAAFPNGDLWIGTNNGGLNFYNKKEKKFTVYRHIAGDSTSIPFDKIYKVFLDSKENLWILSNADWDNLPSTLSFLKKGSTKFINYTQNFYNGIIEDEKGDIFIGGFHGFWKFHTKTHQFELFKNDSIISKLVWAIHQDRKGNIWIGNQNGLAKYDTTNRNFIDYSKHKGIKAHNVYGVLSDKEDNVWISTNSGLMKLINAVNLSFIDGIAIRIYNKDDGLPSKEFIYNASFIDRDGEMYFGGNNGFVRFRPAEIKDGRFEPNIVLSDLIISDQSIKEGEIVHGDTILKQPLNKSAQITLSNRVKSFTLKFDAIHYANPEKNRFKYKLDNFSSNWEYANSYNNYVTYSNLASGTYTFRVYAINNDGIYSPNPKTLDIIILPPFWETWLFRGSLILILFLLIYSFFRLRVKKYQIQKQTLQKAVDKRTEELNLSNKELQNQKQEILSQNEKLITQRHTIEQKNELLETANINLLQLNDFGKNLTSKLRISDIQQIIKKHITKLMQVDVIGFGFSDKEVNMISFTDVTRGDKILPDFKISLDSTTSLASQSLRNNEPIVSNNFEVQHPTFKTELPLGKAPKSIFYLPLTINKNTLGILIIQSNTLDAFSKKNIAILYSLHAYISIALDNSFTYDIVKNQKNEIEKHHHHLEQIVAERTKKLELAKNKAEESDKLKSAFLANMSHEIRTPLNGIIGFVDMLDKPDILPQSASYYHNIIKKSGYTLLQLISDIIDLSKIEAGQIEISIRDINLTSFLDDIYRSFSTQIKNDNKKNHIALLLENTTSDEIIIKTDYVRLQQIFNNLISNAIKFTSTGSISFGIKEVITDEKIVFFVKDTGIGIDKKNHALIFERFHKIEDDNTILYRGSGLGLAISKHLIWKLGGEMHVESELKKGSTFYLSIPYKAQKQTKLHPIVETIDIDEIPDWSGKTFLIAEDEETNFLVISTIMSATNAIILRAKNGVEAINIYKKNIDTIDIVLLDIKMPLKDGIETVKEIKQLNPKAYVIAQTAYAHSNEEKDIRGAGFNDYISKPILSKDLFQLISKYIN